MDSNKPKEGVSVKELKSFAQGHRFEVFMCVALLLACIFSFAFLSFLCLLLAPIGGILGVIFANKIEELFKKIALFVSKQETTTQIVLGGSLLVVSLFLPYLVFLFLGLAGGRFFRKVADESLPK